MPNIEPGWNETPRKRRAVAQCHRIAAMITPDLLRMRTLALIHDIRVVFGASHATARRAIQIARGVR